MTKQAKFPKTPTVEKGAGLTPALLSMEDAARYLDLSVVTLRRWTQEGRIPHLRAGRLLKFRLADLDRWIEERTTTNWESGGR